MITFGKLLEPFYSKSTKEDSKSISEQACYRHAFVNECKADFSNFEYPFFDLVLIKTREGGARQPEYVVEGST